MYQIRWDESYVFYTANTVNLLNLQLKYFYLFSWLAYSLSPSKLDVHDLEVERLYRLRADVLAPI